MAWIQYIVYLSILYGSSTWIGRSVAHESVADSNPTAKWAVDIFSNQRQQQQQKMAELAKSILRTYPFNNMIYDHKADSFIINNLMINKDKLWALMVALLPIENKCACQCQIATIDNISFKLEDLIEAIMTTQIGPVGTDRINGNANQSQPEQGPNVLPTDLELYKFLEKYPFIGLEYDYITNNYIYHNLPIDLDNIWNIFLKPLSIEHDDEAHTVVIHDQQIPLQNLLDIYISQHKQDIWNPIVPHVPYPVEEKQPDLLPEYLPMPEVYSFLQEFPFAGLYYDQYTNNYVYHNMPIDMDTIWNIFLKPLPIEHNDEAHTVLIHDQQIPLQNLLDIYISQHKQDNPEPNVVNIWPNFPYPVEEKQPDKLLPEFLPMPEVYSFLQEFPFAGLYYDQYTNSYVYHNMPIDMDTIWNIFLKPLPIEHNDEAHTVLIHDQQIPLQNLLDIYISQHNQDNPEPNAVNIWPNYPYPVEEKQPDKPLPEFLPMPEVYSFLQEFPFAGLYYNEYTNTYVYNNMPIDMDTIWNIFLKPLPIEHNDEAHTVLIHDQQIPLQILLDIYISQHKQDIWKPPVLDMWPDFTYPVEDNIPPIQSTQFLPVTELDSFIQHYPFIGLTYDQLTNTYVYQNLPIDMDTIWNIFLKPLPIEHDDILKTVLIHDQHIPLKILLDKYVSHHNPMTELDSFIQQFPFTGLEYNQLTNNYLYQNQPIDMDSIWNIFIRPLPIEHNDQAHTVLIHDQHMPLELLLNQYISKHKPETKDLSELTMPIGNNKLPAQFYQFLPVAELDSFIQEFPFIGLQYDQLTNNYLYQNQPINMDTIWNIFLKPLPIEHDDILKTVMIHGQHIPLQILLDMYVSHHIPMTELYSFIQEFPFTGLEYNQLTNTYLYQNQPIDMDTIWNIFIRPVPIEQNNEAHTVLIHGQYMPLELLLNLYISKHKPRNFKEPSFITDHKLPGQVHSFLPLAELDSFVTKFPFIGLKYDPRTNTYLYQNQPIDMDTIWNIFLKPIPIEHDNTAHTVSIHDQQIPLQSLLDIYLSKHKPEEYEVQPDTFDLDHAAPEDDTKLPDNPLTKYLFENVPLHELHFNPDSHKYILGTQDITLPEIWQIITADFPYEHDDSAMNLKYDNYQAPLKEILKLFTTDRMKQPVEQPQHVNNMLPSLHFIELFKKIPLDGLEYNPDTKMFTLHGKQMTIDDIWHQLITEFPYAYDNTARILIIDGVPISLQTIIERFSGTYIDVSVERLVPNVDVELNLIALLKDLPFKGLKYNQHRKRYALWKDQRLKEYNGDQLIKLLRIEAPSTYDRLMVILRENGIVLTPNELIAKYMSLYELSSSDIDEYITKSSNMKDYLFYNKDRYEIKQILTALPLYGIVENGDSYFLNGTIYRKGELFDLIENYIHDHFKYLYDVLFNSLDFVVVVGNTQITQDNIIKYFHNRPVKTFLRFDKYTQEQFSNIPLHGLKYNSARGVYYIGTNEYRLEDLFWIIAKNVKRFDPQTQMLIIDGRHYPLHLIVNLFLSNSIPKNIDSTIGIHSMPDISLNPNMVSVPNFISQPIQLPNAETAGENVKNVWKLDINKIEPGNTITAKFNVNQRSLPVASQKDSLAGEANSVPDNTTPSVKDDTLPATNGLEFPQTTSEPDNLADKTLSK